MNITRSKAFNVGFLIVLLLFAAANIYSYDWMLEQECFDCIKSFGLPFSLYETGTIHHITRILWDGLIADVLIAISASMGVGLFCKWVFNVEKGLA